jgi:hypothetical protein
MMERQRDVPPPPGLPKPQNDLDFAFSRRSADELPSDDASFPPPPNLKPVGIGAPFIGLEILTLGLVSGGFSGEGARSRGFAVFTARLLDE